MTVPPRVSSAPLTIVSGGQTGVDRVALDFAIAAGIPYDGWCPAGRRAEDGTLPSRYRLRETPSRRYDQRTRWNVRDSDATVIFAPREPLTGGTRLTAELARKAAKPLLILYGDQQTPDEAARQLNAFVRDHRVKRLNVAGPRASQTDADVLGLYVDDVFARSPGILPGN